MPSGGGVIHHERMRVVPLTLQVRVIERQVVMMMGKGLRVML